MLNIKTIAEITSPAVRGTVATAFAEDGMAHLSLQYTTLELTFDDLRSFGEELVSAANQLERIYFRE